MSSEAQIGQLCNGFDSSVEWVPSLVATSMAPEQSYNKPSMVSSNLTGPNISDGAMAPGGYFIMPEQLQPEKPSRHLWLGRLPATPDLYARLVNIFRYVLMGMCSISTEYCIAPMHTSVCTSIMQHM